MQRCKTMLAEEVQTLANQGLSRFWARHIYETAIHVVDAIQRKVL